MWNYNSPRVLRRRYTCAAMALVSVVWVSADLWGTVVCVSGTLHSDSDWEQAGRIQQQHGPWDDRVHNGLGSGYSSSTVLGWWNKVPTLAPGGSHRRAVTYPWWWSIKSVLDLENGAQTSSSIALALTGQSYDLGPWAGTQSISQLVPRNDESELGTENPARQISEQCSSSGLIWGNMLGHPNPREWLLGPLEGRSHATIAPALGRRFSSRDSEMLHHQDQCWWKL